MKVQRVQSGEQDRVSWLVIGDDYLPIGPIQDYLTYLEDLERSPHTIRAYAYHLCLFWQYLQHTHCDWTSVGLSELAAFVSWLRQPHTDFISLQEETSRRSETTINAILSAVAMLYEYHDPLRHSGGRLSIRNGGSRIAAIRVCCTTLANTNPCRRVW